MSFNTNRWSCYRWRHAVNSAKNFLGKIFLIIWVFVGETRLPLYPSWCQISHLTKTETEPQISNPSLGFTLAEPQTGIIVKSWFGVLSQSFPSSGWRKQSFWEGKRQKFELKLFLLGPDQYKRYILQKTGSKTAICVLRTGLSNSNPLMWGSHGQLDDWPTKTQMTIGDHLVGWATNLVSELVDEIEKEKAEDKAWWATGSMRPIQLIKIAIKTFPQHICFSFLCKQQQRQEQQQCSWKFHFKHCNALL